MIVSILLTRYMFILLSTIDIYLCIKSSFVWKVIILIHYNTFQSAYDILSVQQGISLTPTNIKDKSNNQVTNISLIFPKIYKHNLTLAI